MTARSTSVAIAIVLAFASSARADPEDAYRQKPEPPHTGVDPAYPITLEAYGTFGFLASVSGYGASEFGLGGGVTLGLPIGERRQIIIGGLYSSGTSLTGTGTLIGGMAAYRIMTFTENWRTRLDFGITGDYSYFQSSVGLAFNAKPVSGPGIGGYVSVGIMYHFLPWLGAGLNVGVRVYAINVHFLLDMEPALVVNW